jgi:hypothetical protein
VGQEEESLSLTGEGTRARPVSYRGKRVSREVVADAEACLAVFNEMTGRGLSARTGDGNASAMLRQIVGALLERPHVSRDEWTRAIRNVAANPPDWVDGQLQIGHIFGARAADHALANDGVPRVRRAAPRAGDQAAMFAQIARGGA